MACADPKVAEKQAPFDIETQRPNDFVQYKLVNDLGHATRIGRQVVQRDGCATPSKSFDRCQPDAR